MKEVTVSPQAQLQGLAQGDLTMLDIPMHMIEGTCEASGFDLQTFLLVRMAALATLDAPPASWLLDLAAGSEANLAPKTILGALIAIAPVIGPPHIVSAAANILKALELAEELAGEGK